MSYITVNQYRDLKSVGFSYPEYEHDLNSGRIFFYNNDEYFIGGFCTKEFTEMDIEVAQNGEWLPDDSQLFEWLHQTGFEIRTEAFPDNFYLYIEVIDTINGATYHAGGCSFADAAANVIKKS